MSSSVETTLYLLRHGKVNGLPALYGHTDIEVEDEINNSILNHLNQLQKALGCNTITQVITSPLQRCSKIAEKFAKFQGLPLEKNAAFKEMYFGDFDGVTFDAIKGMEKSECLWKTLENFWQDPSQYPLPQAELLQDFYERIHLALNSIIEKHHGKKILLICHGGVIRMILSYILNLNYTNQALFSQLSIKNASITVLKNIKTHSNNTSATYTHNNVVTISTPLACMCMKPDEFQ